MKKYRTFALWDGEDGISLDYRVNKDDSRDNLEWDVVQEYSDYSEEDWFCACDGYDGPIVAGYYFPVEIEVDDD